MLVNRWGIFWRPLRIDIRKVPQVIAVCMKLHNFIIDTGDLKIPVARVFRETAPFVLRDQRTIQSRPRLRTMLSEYSGRYNTTTRVDGQATRDFLLNYTTSAGLTRPPRSGYRRGR